MQLIVPTIWRPADVVGTLRRYLEAACIKRLILIDNAPESRPSELEALQNDSKLLVLAQAKNLLVNPSWNLGVSQITDPDTVIGILNDDIELPICTLLRLELHHWQPGDVIGLMPDELPGTPFSLQEISYLRGQSIGHQYRGFGSALLMQRRSYREIPASLRIWFGDDWLLHQARRVLGFRDGAIKRHHHISMHKMRRSPAFRQQLATDKDEAKRLLGLQL